MDELVLTKADATYMYSQLNWFDYHFKKDVQIEVSRLNKLSSQVAKAHDEMMSAYNRYTIEQIAASKQYFDMHLLELQSCYVRMKLTKNDIKETKKVIRQAKKAKDLETLKYLVSLLESYKEVYKKCKYEYKRIYEILDAMINNSYLCVIEYFYC